MTASKIEWTDRSDWNPVRGCTRVSPGCGGPGPHGGCYAEAMAARFSKPGLWGHGIAEMKDGQPRWTGKVELHEPSLLKPLSWRKPAKVFAASTSDIFHEKLPDKAIDKIFAVMALCPHLTFQVLTKRPERMRAYLSAPMRVSSIEAAGEALLITTPISTRVPLPNVWLGVSAERQEEANERIPHLLATPAAVRFVSCEPLLGPIDLRQWLEPRRGCANCGDGQLDGKCCDEPLIVDEAALDWVIVGGESGARARPFDLEWARSIIGQCKAAGVACFIKQVGSHPVDSARPCAPHDHPLRLVTNSKKGGDPAEWPPELRVREVPHAA